MTSRVFILEPVQPNIDVSTAEKFGALTYVFERGMSRCSVFNSQEYEDTILKRLIEMKFDPDRDYLCMAGRIVCIAVFCVVATREFGTIDALMFDAHENSYVNKLI